MPRSKKTPLKLPAKPQDIDFKKLFDWRYKHQLPLVNISELSGVPKSTLADWYKPIDQLIKNPESLELYKRNRPSILSSLECELIKDLTDSEKRKKASLNNVAYAFQQIHVARRLEEGLSTGNLAVNVEKSLTNAHELAQKQRKKLRESAAS